MTFKPHLLVVACSLLASVSACFSDRGLQADGTTGGTGTTGGAGTTGDTGEGVTGGPDPEIVGLCNESFARRGTIAEAQCQCQVDQGMFPDVAACLAKAGAGASDACTCEVYGDSPETRAGLECAAPAQQAVIECIAGLSCAPNTSAFDTCIDTYYTAISTCAAPPRAVVGQVAIQCEMVPPLNCGSGETIPETWKCDLKNDCMDGSDEAECAGTFMCKDGQKSIDEALKCDDFPDCADGSDEQSCPTFMCMNGKVILLLYRCDGFPDCCTEAEPECADQSDELNCPMFTCTDGTTIPLEFKCDGFEDCLDGADEMDCMSDSTGG